MEFELRKWKIEDADDIAHFANNEKIAANLRNVFPYPYSLADAKAYIEGCIKAGDDNSLCRAIVVDGRAAGSIGVFLGQDVYCRNAELGYWLAEDYWGRGIVTEAASQICKAAFDKFDIVRIFAEPYAYNIGSRRVLEKAGFSLEGTMKQGVFKNGKIFDYCMYAVLR